MRNLHKRSLFVVACLAVASFVSAQQPDVFAIDKRGKEALKKNPHLIISPTRVLVRFREDSPRSERAQAVANVKGLKLHEFELVPGLELVDVSEGNARAIQALKHNPHVLYAEPDAVLRPTATPNDPSFSKQWGLNQSSNIDINAPEVWASFTGDPNFKVAVLDTGVDYNHPDLRDNMWRNPGEIAGNGVDDDGNGFKDDVYGYDFINNDSDPMDDVDHGTHCAGIIAATGNNGIGISGVNWRAKIVALKFLGPDGGVTSDAIRALDYAQKMGIKVSSNSYGGEGTSEQAFKDALNAAAAANHVFVAAAGNDGRDNELTANYPSNYTMPNLVAVAALDASGALASYSNWGATSVDIAAPGSSIYSTVPGGGYAYMSGTSMATPHVAGVIALVYAQNPTWTYSQVIGRVLGTVRKMSSLSGKVVSGGMVDAAAALRTSISSLTVGPAYIFGSTAATGTVTIGSPAPSGGAVVKLVSSNTASLPVPASVTVAAGATSANFTMNAVNNTTSIVNVTVTATYSGASKSATVAIRPSNFAQFIGQSVPTSMVAGQAYTVWFDYKNTGGVTWTPATLYRLTFQNPRLNTTWGPSRVPLITSSVVPGATGRFQATIYAPMTAGTYNMQVKPIQENVVEFGQISTNVPVIVSKAPDSARYISQVVPTTVAAGADFNASIVMRNVGTNAWSSAGGYQLASRSPWNNANWGTTRVLMASGSSAAPGADYTFARSFTAPSVPGTYYFQWSMLKVGTLFGDLSQTVAIQVTASSNAAQFVGQTGAPTATVAKGAKFSVTFTFKNTGTASWSSAHSLQSVGTSSFGVASLPSGTVTPGANGTFTGTLTAPATAGKYTLQFRMRSGTTWFGDRTVPVTVTVA